MKLRITDMNRGGQAFLVDESDRQRYYKHNLGTFIRPAENMDYYPMNLPALIDAVTGEEKYWFDRRVFSPIAFDELDDADYYIDAVAKHEIEAILESAL
jgi:hypothetical protein